MPNASEVQLIAIEKIKLLERNPRKINEERFKKLCESVDKNPDFFNVRPCLVNDASGELVVYAGNQRLRAAKAMGRKEVPCIIETLTDEQQRERTIRDNVELGEWDWELLAEDWKKDELESWGVECEFNTDEEGKTDPDEVPEAPEIPKAKLGDIYQLGDHRLMCGSATIAEDVEKLMGGEKADMVFTDPPYGVTKNEWDRMFTQEDLDMLFSITDGAILVWNATKPEVFKHMLGLSPLCDRVAVWRMTSGITGKGGMFWTWQPIFAWRSRDIKLWDSMEFESDSPTRTGEHPTQKPVGLIKKWINADSKIKSVADLFGGSGSTLIACEQTKRRCYMMELDPKYIDVIIKRWEDFTAKKAIKC